MVRPAESQSATYSLFPASSGPTTTGSSGGNSVEVGMRFTVDQPGQVTAIRYYKNPNAPATTHSGNIWTGNGTILAFVTFAGETSGGWQEATLSTPVTLIAGLEYVVSYHTVGFSVTQQSSWPRVSGPIHGISSGYDYGAGPALFPRQPMYMGSNYWVDLVFVPGTAPSPTATPAATLTPTPTPSDTPTPGPTSTPWPTSTPVSQATPSTSMYPCTEVVGFSVTSAWYTSFIASVPNPQEWQLRWFSGGSIDQWAAGSSFPGWASQYLVTHCAQNSTHPDRVLLNISGDYNTDPVWWSAQTLLTMNFINGTYSPGVRQIILQAPVGGPAGSMCPTSDPLSPLPWIRATYNWPIVEQAITGLLGGNVHHGAWTEVASCADYADSTGHLTSSAANQIGASIAAFYSQSR